MPTISLREAARQVSDQEWDDAHRVTVVCKNCRFTWEDVPPIGGAIADGEIHEFSLVTHCPICGHEIVLSDYVSIKVNDQTYIAANTLPGVLHLLKELQARLESGEIEPEAVAEELERIGPMKKLGAWLLRNHVALELTGVALGLVIAGLSLLASASQPAQMSDDDIARVIAGVIDQLDRNRQPGAP
jgi:hypothetical protein